MALGKRPNPKLTPFLSKLGSEFNVFTCRGTMFIRQPVDMLMGGFWFDPSPGSPELRWISIFSCPLYLPSDHVWLNWGHRIPGPGLLNKSPTRLSISGNLKAVEETIEIMREGGLATVLPMLSLEGFYEYLLSWPAGAKWVQSATYEALGYTAALLNLETDAKIHLNNCRAMLNSGDSTKKHDWEESSFSRVESMLQVFGSQGLEAVIDQLRIWRNDAVIRFDLDDSIVDARYVK